jgi:hypothetical protein
VSGRTCANCGAPLTGPYCAECGQHAHESSRAIGTLFHDAWHVVTHVDTRFWRTLRLLLVKPGSLTREYFAERRARYLPPFRLYIVLSLIFFGLASVSSRSPTGGVLDLDDAREAARSSHAAAADQARERLNATVPQGAMDASAARADADTDADSRSALILDTKDCDRVEAFGWERFKRPLTDACRRVAADHGRSATRAFVANIPKMMFVFLPLMALLMMLLYWRPRRYYVEHLVYFLHTHSALFLAFMLQMLAGLAARAWLVLEPALGPLRFTIGVYAIWYVYRSMRVYYGQARGLTICKLVVVGLAYFVFLTVSVLGTLFVSVLTA